MAEHGDGVAYSPTPSRLFLRILCSLPVRRPAAFTFIDLGCGTGRTLLLAADHGYGRVIGVELDPALAADAEHHVRGRSETIAVVTADADDCAALTRVAKKARWATYASSEALHHQ
jgi:predicted RNA methylase